MPSIGGISCLFIRGVMPGNKRRLRTWIVWGISGYGSKLGGYGDSAWKVDCEFWSNETGAELWIRSIEALQGAVVTIVDDHGRTYYFNLVEKISQPVKEAKSNGGTLGIMAKLTVSGVRK